MKNTIKSPKEDTLRGIGKLGWTEGGKMNSTIKRLESSFSDEKVRSIKTNKEEYTCSVCKFKYRSNNPERVPTHKRHRYLWSRGHDEDICSGSYIKQPTGEKFTEILEYFTTFDNRQKFHPGDKVLIDFTRTILKEYYPGCPDEIIDSEVERIEKISNVLNDGTLGACKEIAYFKGVPNPINVLNLKSFITLNI
jgi:hypothetical protein